MRSEYRLDELDQSIFGPGLKRQLGQQRCQEAGCGGELRWTSPQKTVQLGQSVTLAGTCVDCGARHEMEFRL
ncbi:MAG TPA: hypothetical protein VM031_02590 [Phycisphaerae bacterium]|nr:hypothetical protein [Phycisphaerae bacterium]